MRNSFLWPQLLSLCAKALVYSPLCPSIPEAGWMRRKPDLQRRHQVQTKAGCCVPLDESKA